MPASKSARALWGSPERREKLLSGAALFFIVATGAGLRLYGLGEQSVWFDEWQSVTELDAPSLFSFLRAERAHDWYMTPVYFVFQYIWAHGIARSDTGIRVLSVVIGCSSIVLLYFFGRELFGRRAGLIAALCMSLSFFHLFQAQELRPYALMVMWALLSAYTFVRVVRGGSRYWWVAHAVANVLLVWTHLFGAFLFVAEGCFLLAFRRRGRWIVRWGVLMLFLLIPSFVWILTIDKHFKAPAGPPVLSGLLHSSFCDVLANDYSPILPTNVTWANPPPAWAQWFITTYGKADGALLGLFILGIIVTGARALLRRRAASQADGGDCVEIFVFLLFWLFLPVAGLWLFALISRPDALSARYTAYCSLAGYLLLGAAFGQSRRLIVSIIAVAAILSLFGHRLALTLAEPQRTQWKELGRLVKERNPERSVVLTHCAGLTTPSVFQYNLKSDTPVADWAMDLRDIIQKTEQNLAEGKDLWLILNASDRALAVSYEHYLMQRKIEFSLHAYFSARVLGILAYHVPCAPGFVAVGADVIEAGYKAVTEGYEAAQECRRRGASLLESGNGEESIAEFGRAYSLTPWDKDTWGARSSESAGAARDCALAREFERCGKELMLRNRLDAARSAYRKAFELSSYTPDSYELLSDALQVGTPDYDTLAAVSREMADAHPDHAKAHALLGTALRELGDVPGAILAFRKAAEIAPNESVAVHRELSELLFQQHDPGGAASAARDGLRCAPEDAQLLWRLAEALGAQGDNDGAIEALRQMIQIDPRSHDAHASLISILLKNKRDFAGAAAACREALEADPARADYHASLGEALESAGDEREAVKAYEEAVRLSPTRAAWVFARLAILLQKGGGEKEAVRALRQGLSATPDDSILRTHLVAMLARTGDVEGALAEFQKGIRSEAVNTALYESLVGSIGSARGSAEAIEKASREMIACKPDYASAYARLGIALHEQGKKDEAIEALRKSAELGPDDFPWKYGHLARLLLERGDYDGSIAASRQGLERLKDDVFLWVNLGIALRMKGEYGPAVEALNKATASPAPSGEAYWNLALALLGQGNTEMAVPAAHKAFDLDGGIKNDFREVFEAIFERKDFDAAWKRVKGGRAVPSEMLKKLQQDSGRSE